jgi:hypothetical protein
VEGILIWETAFSDKDGSKYTLSRLKYPEYKPCRYVATTYGLKELVWDNGVSIVFGMGKMSNM